jgi:IS30 family transposase
MAAKKIPYQDWMKIDSIDSDHTITEAEKRLTLEYVVRNAVQNLNPIDREFIERYYFQGQSFFQIAMALGKNPDRIYNIHRRTLKRLRSLLADFAVKRYGVKINNSPDCPLCQSPHKSEIDILIKKKKKSETWKKIIRKLEENYRIRIKTPQVLIGHQKYHIKENYYEEETSPSRSLP